MPPNIDLHIHTIYSDGKSDLNDIVEEAEKKGLDAIAFTDHGFMHRYGVTREGFENFLNKGKILKENSNTTVLLGIEAEAHHLDVVMEYRNDLDYVLLANHICVDDKRLYEVILEKMRIYNVDAVAHPYFLGHEIDEAIELAVARNIAFEINSRRYVPEPDVIRKAAREGVNFTIGSDAHERKDIGRTGWAYKVIEKLDIDDSIIDVNNLI